MKQRAPEITNEPICNDMLLTGTASSTVKDFAVLLDKSRKQTLCKLGDKIRGLGTIVKIERNKVLVSRDDGICVIRIVAPNGQLLSDSVQVANLASHIAEDSYRAEQGETPPSREAQNQIMPDVPSLSKPGMSYVIDPGKIQQAIENPNRIMTDVLIHPNMVNGKQRGAILNEVRQGGIYESLGLQNFDILLRINGSDISNSEDTLKAVNALKSKDRVSLDYIRDGVSLTTRYIIK